MCACFPQHCPITQWWCWCLRLCFSCPQSGHSLVTGTGADLLVPLGQVQGWAHTYSWSHGYVLTKQLDSHPEHLVSRTASPPLKLWPFGAGPNSPSQSHLAWYSETVQPSSSSCPHHNDNSYYLVADQAPHWAARGLSLPLCPGVLTGPRETTNIDFIFEARGPAKNTQLAVCGEAGRENQIQSRVVCLARK